MFLETAIFECTATVPVPLPEIDYSGVCGSFTYELVTEVINSEGEVLYSLEDGDPRLLEGVMPGDYTFRFTLANDCGDWVKQDCFFRVIDRADLPGGLLCYASGLKDRLSPGR